MDWKVIVRINGKKVDECLCVNREAALHAWRIIMSGGFDVYSVHNPKSFSLSILKIKKSVGGK